VSIDDLWYKNAVIYCLDVEKYQETQTATASAISKG
jgi:hypothetical protein